MYNPPAFAVSETTDVLGALRRLPFGHLVTAGPGGLASTPMPFVVDDELTALRGHLARANPHWRDLDGLEALMIVAGPDAYVSPRWYPSKLDHGRVVPTWNYEVLQVRGIVTIHHDAPWKAGVVGALTDHNELRVDDPGQGDTWAVSDAPADFIDAQLRAIVGVSLEITSIDAKRKLSQNKAEPDQAGVVDGLGRSNRPEDLATARLMAAPDEE